MPGIYINWSRVAQEKPPVDSLVKTIQVFFFIYKKPATVLFQVRIPWQIVDHKLAHKYINSFFIFFLKIIYTNWSLVFVKTHLKCLNFFFFFFSGKKWKEEDKKKLDFVFRLTDPSQIYEIRASSFPAFCNGLSRLYQSNMRREYIMELTLESFLKRTKNKIDGTCHLPVTAWIYLKSLEIFQDFYSAKRRKSMYESLL